MVWLFNVTDILHLFYVLRKTEATITLPKDAVLKNAIDITGNITLTDPQKNAQKENGEEFINNVSINN